MWVVLSHIFCWAGFLELTAPSALQALWSEFIRAGAAVEIFMILSGFAISFLLHKRQQSYRQFIQGRLFRIYPVYLVCLLLALIAAVRLTPFVLHTASWRNTLEWERSWSSIESSAPALHAFWHITLLNGLIPARFLSGATVTLLPPAWSISLEWQYYLFAPFVACFCRSGVRFLILIAVAWLGLRFGYIWQNPHLAFLPAQLPLFLIGIGSYHLYEHFVKSSHRRSSIFALPVAALLGSSILIQWHTTALVVWALAFGCIFVQGNDVFSRTLAALRRFLLHPWLQRLGHISYPIYLVHWPLIIAFLATLLHWSPRVSSRYAVLLMLSLCIPLILICANVLHIFVELPLMTLGKRLSSRDATPPA